MYSIIAGPWSKYEKNTPTSKAVQIRVEVIYPGMMVVSTAVVVVVVDKGGPQGIEWDQGVQAEAPAEGRLYFYTTPT